MAGFFGLPSSALGIQTLTVDPHCSLRPSVISDTPIMIGSCFFCNYPICAIHPSFVTVKL